MQYKKILLLFSFIGFGNSLFGQNKKELVEMLNKRVDSLQLELIKSNDNLNRCKEDLFSANQSLDKQNRLYENTATTLNSVKTEKDKITQILNQKSIALDSLIKIRIKDISLLKDSFFVLLNKYRSGYYLPFSLRDTSFNSNSKKYKYYKKDDLVYMILDTFSIEIRNFDRINFHLIVPIRTQDDMGNLFDCPNNYGLLATDNFGGNIVFEDYWTWQRKSSDSLKGNQFRGFYSIGSTKGRFTILNLSETACGSGGESRYYKVLWNNGKIGFELYEETQIGYSDLVIFEEKDYYIKLKKINPEEHYGPAQYSIEAMRISDNSILFKRTTKNKYSCFTESGSRKLLDDINSYEQVLSGLPDK